MLKVYAGFKNLRGTPVEALGKPPEFQGPHIIPVTDFSWELLPWVETGGKRSQVVPKVAGTARGTYELSPLTLVTNFGLAAVAMVDSMIHGSVHETGEIHVYRQADSKLISYINLKLTNVLFTKVELGSAWKGGVADVRAEITFESYAMTVTPYDSKGNTQAKREGRFNFITHKSE